MTIDQLIRLLPCRKGLDFAAKFPSVKEAWLSCTNISHLLWLAAKQTKRKDLIVLFAEECAGRALTYNGLTAYSSARCATWAGDAEFTDDYSEAADAAFYAAESAGYAYDRNHHLYEKEIQRERIYELFTDIIFPPN